MSSMIELMRQSAVPASLMRVAAKGALEVPPAEMIEILVFLAAHPIFGDQARMTLAGWDEKACLAVAADPQTVPAVIEYMMAPENRRPSLLPALIDNPAVSEMMLMELAQTPKREVVDMLMGSQRVHQSAVILNALVTNHTLKPEELKLLTANLEAMGEFWGEAVDPVAAEQAVEQWRKEHAAEITAEEGKPFELVEEPAAAAAAAPVAAAADPNAVDEKTLAMRKAAADSRERISTMQKLARLSVGERVQVAMKGNKDERALLIRDGSKVVCLAVLASPKISDGEVENFASLKNVQQNVLREIARNRKFIKNYGTVRNLVNNPRCPLDLSITLIKNLLVTDLKSVSANKNVPDTLRKLALRNLQEKKSGSGKTG